MAQEDVRHDDSSSVLSHPHPSSSALKIAASTGVIAATASPPAPAVPATLESTQLPPTATSSSVPISTATSTPTPSSASPPSTLAALAAVSDPTGGCSSAATPAAAADAAATPSPASSTLPPAAVAPPAPTSGTVELQQNGHHKGHEPHSDPDMSNQHPGAPHGQPMSYPGSSSPYHSAAGMPTAQYASYPTTTSQPGDAYRMSPVASNAMSLPSMRTIDSMPQQPGAPMGHHQGMPMNMTMGPVSGGMPFYGHHGMAMSPGYGLPPDALTRYQLPHDPRLMGHRGPKKEIKRRTKTGCLTCRKRRIKCDETHPTCNNCKKSKRECLGYDPIFRQQASGSQSNAGIPQTSTSQPTTPSAVPSSIASSIPSSGPAHAAAGSRTSNSYGSQPSMLPSAYSSSQASHPSPTAIYDATASVTPTSVKSEPGYEYSSSIDPALQTLPSTTSHISVHQDSSRPLQHKPLLDNSSHLRAKKMKIEEIIDSLGPSPPPQQISHTEEALNEVTKVYHEMYAGGLSAFFETGWYYFVENGKMTFPEDPDLIERMATFLKILEAVKANDHSQMASSGILETRIVWQLARTVYQTPEKTNALKQTLPPDGDAVEARNRVQVVEALLCGEYLPTNPLTPPSQDIDPHRTRQFEFWYALAEFVCMRDNPRSIPAVQEREDVLARLRRLLDGRENRDVLYSIAVVRELAPNFDPNYGSTIPQHLDETDPKNRLAVASKFILDESQVTGGTTNVVRRFCDIASRAFVNPGVNVGRIA